MYKQINNFVTKEAVPAILRIADNTFIPFDLANVDYVEYLKWLAEGNTVLPPDEPVNA